MPKPMKSGRDPIAGRDAATFFDASKLKLARELRQMSQADIARIAREHDAGFGAPAVSQWETGRNHPSSESVQWLAKILQVNPEFFIKDSTSDGYDTRPVFFRSLKSASPKVRYRARARAHVAHALVQTLETHIDLPPVNLPQFDLDLDSSEDDQDEAAAAIRVHFGLPSGPIPSVVRLMETHGVIVIREDDTDAKVDAFSVTFDDRPLVVLGDAKQDRARSRFDAAHELAHLICHRRLDAEHAEGNRVIEGQAMRVGAAVLMPADDIGPEFERLGRRIGFDDLLPMKLEWNVSLAALVRRAYTLDCIDKTRYETMNKTIRVRGWNKPNGEPGRLGAPEAPALLPEAIRVADENGLSLETLAAEAHLPIDAVESIVATTRTNRPKVTIPRF